jgi:hypothetical protein
MFRGLPPQGGTARDVSEIVNNTLNGKTNNTGSVTLATGATTTLTDERISPSSKIVLIPKTADSAGATGVYISAQAYGSATILHTGNVSTDKIYDYIVVG